MMKLRHVPCPTLARKAAKQALTWWVFSLVITSSSSNVFFEVSSDHYLPFKIFHPTTLDTHVSHYSCISGSHKVAADMLWSL